MIDLITLSLVMGILGSLTGVISLFWHIKNNKPKLKLESAYFQRHGFGVTIARGYEHIGVRIRLRNLSNTPTTIEKVYIEIGNIFQEAPFFKEIEIPKHSSKTFEYTLDFEEKRFEELFDKKGEIQFGVFIHHTYGTIKKREKITFKTGHFTMK